MALALASQSDQGEFISSVSSLRELFAGDLERVNSEILDRLQSPVAMIPDLAGHLVRAGGKRLRPLLTLGAAGMLDYTGDKHIPLAAAVELIHGATLLHDDVVDASALRRGVHTANVIWGNKESVLVGDYIFSRAFELMVATENLRVLQILSRASSIIAEGEVLQLGTQKNLSTTEAMYLDVVNAKTAALFSAATHSAGMVAGADRAAETALSEFGTNFGIAYQLIDDALDYAGFETSLGKSIGDDFREGKMTLPVILAVEHATSEERLFWNRTIGDGVQHKEDFMEACRIIGRHEGVERTLALAAKYADSALENLKALPENPVRQAFHRLVESSLTRLS